MNKFSLNEIIEMAVQIEKSGYTYYENALKRKDLDDRSRELLTILKNDEVVHEQTFKSLRDDTDIEDIFSSGDWEQVSNYLKNISDSHIFSKPERAINLAVQAKDYKEIITNAIAFEKDTLLYFHSLGQYITDEKARAIIRKIIDEEAGHVVKLRSFLKEA